MAMETDERPPLDYEDITPDKDGGVLKRIVKPGTGEDKPAVGCQVNVHYVGTLENGDKFDSSRDRGDLFQFQLGKGNVIKGWDLGVATMLQNEVCELKIEAKYAYGERGSPPKIPPNATLVFEIELFSWKDEDVTPDGGVVKRMIQEGVVGGGKPNLEGSVKIHVRGTYEGRVFDERDVEFIVGDGYEHGIVEGIEKGVVTMKRYEKAKYFIRSPYGFKSEGNPTFEIPPNADIIYEVVLFDFEKAKEIYEMSYDEKIEKSKELKERALKCIKASEYQKAIDYYERILQFVRINKEDSDYPLGLPYKIAANSNAAMCFLKLKDYNKALVKTEKVIKLDPGNVKGHFRHGESLLGIKDYQNAVKSFESALKLEPDNTAVKKQLQFARNLYKKQVADDKKLYSSIFAKMSTD